MYFIFVDIGLMDTSKERCFVDYEEEQRLRAQDAAHTAAVSSYYHLTGEEPPAGYGNPITPEQREQIDDTKFWRPYFE